MLHPPISTARRHSSRVLSSDAFCLFFDYCCAVCVRCFCAVLVLVARCSASLGEAPVARKAQRAAPKRHPQRPDDQRPTESEQRSQHAPPATTNRDNDAHTANRQQQRQGTNAKRAATRSSGEWRAWRRLSRIRVTSKRRRARKQQRQRHGGRRGNSNGDDGTVSSIVARIVAAASDVCPASPFRPALSARRVRSRGGCGGGARCDAVTRKRDRAQTQTHTATPSLQRCTATATGTSRGAGRSEQLSAAHATGRVWCRRVADPFCGAAPLSPPL